MKLVTRKISIDQINHEETGRAARNGRKAEGFSLRAVANKMQFSAPYLSDLENGRRQWSQKLLMTYLGALQALHNERMIPAIQKASKNAHKGPALLIGRSRA